MKSRMFKVGTEEIPWQVDDSGWFRCTVQGKDLQAVSLAALELKAREQAKRAKIRLSIPVAIDDGKDGLENITITGINGRTEAVTIRRGNGAADVLDRYVGAYHPLTLAEQEELKPLVEAAHTANVALNAFKRARQMKTSGGTFSTAMGVKAIAEREITRIQKAETAETVEEEEPSGG